MKNKIALPLLVHIGLTIICYIVFGLTCLGPDGGVLLQILPSWGANIMMILAAIVQLLVLIAYYKTGIKMSGCSKKEVIGLSGIVIINILVLIIVALIIGSIKQAISWLSFFGNASTWFVYLLIHDMRSSNMVNFVICSLLPTVLVCIGYACGTLKLRKTEKK